jgi:SSS family solute:Na+ symporter
VLLLHFFYWTCNQQIIQRTFGASSLAEGQKGVLTTGLFKLFGPLFLVLPGLIAFAMFPDLDAASADQAYGQLVNAVLPTALAGFFAAAMLGAILSSYNSALNSTCTLFSLGLYQGMIRRDATDQEAVASGKVFGWMIALFSMGTAPLLMGQESIFAYLQQMNGIYFIPILSVVLCGMLSPTMPSLSAKVGLILGPVLVACGYFIDPIANRVAAVHEYHFLGMVFLFLVALMLLIQKLSPRTEPWQQPGVEVVDMTPWRYARPVGTTLCGLVVLIYLAFADFA